MSTRLLGTLCIIGSVIVLLDALRQSASGTNGFDTIALLANSAWAIGGIAVLVGMIQLNAVGPNTVVRALAFVPIIGFVLLILANIIQLAGMVTTENNTLAGIGWLAQMAGMVLVGILTIAAKTWSGWQRFIPLLTVVIAPVSFGIGSAIGNLTLGTVIVWVFWMLLGYIVATAEPARAWSQSAAA
jgi:hypothetical protein